MKPKNKTSDAQEPNLNQKPSSMHGLELLINKIMLLDEIIPPDNLLIVHAPPVKPGRCHRYETEKIEEIREDLWDRGERIAKYMKRYKTGNARWVTPLITHAFSKHDAELSSIGQKLANCSCTECGEWI